MLVLHVHDRFSALGGADWHLISILEKMPPSVKVEGLFGRSDGSVPASTAKTLPVKLIKKLDKKAPFFAEKKVAQLAEEFIKTRRPDLVHVHNILNPHILTELAQSASAVITVQDHRFFCPGPGQVLPDGSLCRQPPGPHCKNCFDQNDYFQKVMELVEARLQALQKFKAVIVLSHYMKIALTSAGIEKSKIYVIPPFVHGLEIPSTPASSGQAVLFAGRIVKTKGVFDLLDAFIKTNINAPLIMAGTGPAELQIREKIQTMNLESRVQMIGWVSHEQMTGLFEKSRIVVMPSIWQEPFGIVGLESQAAGRPVVAYDVGGIRDWLQKNVTGILVRPGDLVALGQAIQTLLNNPATADQYGQAGQQITAKKFNPDRLMTDLMGLYSRTIG